MTYSIYLINLDYRSDRLDNSLRQLNMEGLTFARISAVDGRNLKENMFQTPTVLACWQSHLLAYEALLASKSSFALILEDDFQINRKYCLNKNIEKWISLNFDLLQVGFLTIGVFNKMRWVFEETQKLSFRLIGLLAKIFRMKTISSRLRVREALDSNSSITVSSFFPGTHAYIISRKLAGAILSEGANNLSADEYFIALSKMRAFDIGRLWKSRIGQNGSDPSILRRFVSEGKN